MKIDKNLKYSKTHEWVRIEDNTAFIGLTDYAQQELGDIVYVELPEIDDEISKDDEVSTVESVKAASPINSPLSGRVTEVNEELEDTPEMINQKPYDTFIFALEISEDGEIDELMDADEYEEFCEKEKENH